MESVSTRPVKVIVSDHGSTDETPQVIAEFAEKYPFVSGVRLERGDEDDYATNFRHAFGLAATKWTWTFGDDDLLGGNALDVIFDIVSRPEFDEQYQFIHVSEVSRSQNSGKLVKGRLIDLCNNIGWIDMTGFITGNIVRTDKLKEAVALPSWDIYAKNAFVQSCALLEVLHDTDSAFLDVPLIDVQNRDPTEETMERWGQFNVGLRYHYVDDALLDMRKRGIIGTLQPKFFRYLSYFLWDRFLGHIANSYNTEQDFQITDYLDDLFRRLNNLYTFLDGTNRKRYEDEAREVKEAMITHSGALQYAISRAAHLGKLIDNHSQSRFEFEYLMPQPKANPREK